MLTAVRLHFNLDRTRHDDLQHIHIDWELTVKPDDALLMMTTARLIAAAEGPGLTTALLRQEIEQLPCLLFQRRCGLALLRRRSRQVRNLPNRASLEARANADLWRHLEESANAAHFLLVHRVHERAYQQHIAPHLKDACMRGMNKVHKPKREHECKTRDNWEMTPQTPAQQDTPAAAWLPTPVATQTASSAQMLPPSYIPRSMQRPRQPQPQSAQLLSSSVLPSPIVASASAASQPSPAVQSALPSPSRGGMTATASSSVSCASFKSSDCAPRRIHFDPEAPASTPSPRGQPSPAAESSGMVTPMTPSAERRLGLSHEGRLVLADRQRRQSGAPSGAMIDASPRDESTPQEHRQALALQRELWDEGEEEESDAPSSTPVRLEWADEDTPADEAPAEPAQEELPSDEDAAESTTTPDEPQTADEHHDSASVDAKDVPGEVCDSFDAETAFSASQQSSVLAALPPSVDEHMEGSDDESASSQFPQLEDSPPPPAQAAESVDTVPAAAAMAETAAPVAIPSVSPAAFAPSPLPIRRNVVLRQTQSSPMRVEPVTPVLSLSQHKPSGPSVLRQAQRRVTASPVQQLASPASAKAHSSLGSHAPLAASPAAAASPSIAAAGGSAVQIYADLAHSLAGIDEELLSDGLSLPHTARSNPLDECGEILAHWKTLLHDLDGWFAQHPPTQCADALSSLRGGWFGHFESFVVELVAHPLTSELQWVSALRWLAHCLENILRIPLVACLQSAGEATHDRVRLANRLATLHGVTANWQTRCHFSLLPYPAQPAEVQPEPIDMDSHQQTGVQIEEVTEED